MNSSQKNDSPTQRKNPWITHSSKVVYENPWIRVSESQVTNPGGGTGIYGVVHYKNRAMGIIPIDEEDHTWLVGQFRYPTSSYEWEIPEGGCLPDESPLEAAKRELKEETGLIATDFETLIDGIALSNSTSDERCTIFVARNLRQSHAEPEECEELQTKRLPVDEAITMVLDGRITDSVSVIALMRLAISRGFRDPFCPPD